MSSSEMRRTFQWHSLLGAARLALTHHCYGQDLAGAAGVAIVANIAHATFFLVAMTATPFHLAAIFTLQVKRVRHIGVALLYHPQHVWLKHRFLRATIFPHRHDLLDNIAIAAILHDWGR